MALFGRRLRMPCRSRGRAKSLAIKSLATVSARFGVKNDLNSVGELWGRLNSGDKPNTFKTAVSELWQTARFRKKPNMFDNLSALDS